MKKLFTIIIAAAAVLALASCSKDSPASQASSNRNLPGTVWEDDLGNVLTFTGTQVCLNGCIGTYTVVMEFETTTKFSADNLTSGGVTYVSGVASLLDDALYLRERGGRGQLHFTLKK